ncbi:MAG: response regulator [Myxococcales bacterium]|nr:response regulator [Myxococcales bacterium]HRC56547.1 response regulator [Kofleriaceae bacterium]
MKEGRVLVVDDEPGLRSWLSALLAYEGYLVEEASNGAVALEVLQTFRPDVIILDLIMPGMNGREFLLELRESPELAKIPVLVWTAVKGVHINLTSLGATEILEKLPDPDEILRKVALAVYRSGHRSPPTQPPLSAPSEQLPANQRAEVVVVLDAVRSRWPRRVSELEAGGFHALPRMEPMPRALRLAKAVDAVAILVEHSAVSAEPSLAELMAEPSPIAVRRFDATEPNIDDDLLRFLSACAVQRRATRPS